nr:non-ribosomal peptide synthetase [Corallococcus soli]
MRSHPGIRDAVTLVREDVPGDARLVAYVAPEVDTVSLREHLRKHLPEYMVPAVFMALPVLPLTPNGKVDRKALPAPEASQVAASTYVAPETPTEIALAALWSEVLRVPRVGRHDNFFELGGHSLLATQLVTRVRAHFQVELPLRAFFERPTVAALAALIDSFQGPDGTGASLPPLVRAERPEVIPLSFAQQRLWFIEQLGTAGTAYSVPVSLKLEGSLDTVVLLAAFDELVRRHEVLRTTFHSDEGAPSQVIHPPFPMPLRHVDLTVVAQREAREAEAHRLALEEARTPFDLEQGPLLRVLLLKLAPTEHVLVLTKHHIISDGWSTGVLVREMGALYTAFSQGLPSPLPELAVQYADHSLWQRGWLQGEVLEQQLGYWRGQLGGSAPYLDLPTDHPRPAKQSFQAAKQDVVLSRELSEALETLAKQASATPYMLLLAAFKLLLHRYSGQEDVLIGSPIAGRRHAESEALIGYFANTVVIRTQVEPSLTFRELLTRVRATTLGAYEHQDLPFEKLVEDLKPERDLRRTPFFQVTFTLQNAPMPALMLPELTLRGLDMDAGSILFDLQLIMVRGPDGFDGTLLYNTSLFAPETAAGMVQRLRLLLESAVRAPDTRLSGLSLLTPEERRQVLVEWNRTFREYPRDASVAGLFSAQAARTPDAPALKSGEKTLSYAALDRASNQLAHHLRRSGVRPGDRVGLCLERSFELIVGMLGILKAGAAYVPVEAKYPADRIAWMLQEAGVSVLVTQESLADELPAVTDLQVLLDADAAVLAKQPETPLELEVPAEALAYVMFTSGSTGRPKGVSVPQRGIVRLVRGNDFIHFGPEEVFLQLAPVAFDASTLEVWGALLNGAKLVLAPAKALSFEETGALLITEGITTLWLTAALFEQMVIHQGEALAGVRQVLAGGDVLPVERVREHLARMPSGAVLVNGYGPTENTTFSATYALGAGDSVGLSVPIGRPLAQSTAWVLDAALQPVPVGVPGALYVGGDGLAWGYLKRPDLTAERFIPHPFATEPGARLYSTGDRVRWQADGTLEFLGRTDFQVKIRGFRIEPGEVEAVLRQSSQVREAVVLVREDVPGDKRLVAYVVATGEGFDPGALKALTQKQLPEYMVPTAWVELSALPLNANGKVDRKALPVPEAPRASDAEVVAPRNAMETALAAIWAEVLHLEAISIHDDFFELGGHSLLATQVVSRIRSTLGVELPLGDLFGAPTVATLAEKLGSARRTQAPPLVRTERSTAPPLSFAQQRLWFIDQLEPGTSLYNMPLPLRLSGALDEGALRKSLDALMARHESLRTTFRVEAGQPVQHIHSEASVPFESVDLTAIADDTERQAEATRRGFAESRRPFNLEQGPVIRALLLKLGAEDHILVVHLHHIVSDGWSLGVLVREMTALYEAFRHGQAPALPELPVQYADYAVWQRNWLQGDVLKAQLGWWKQQLAGASHVLELPIDKPRPAVVSQRGAGVSVRLPQALSEQVEALAQREGATPFMVLLAAFQSVLHRHSGQDDVLVGSPIANRGHAETEGLIGFFVNTLVLRGSFGARPTFRQLLAQVRATTLGAYEHQDLPFERLVEEIQTTRDLSRTPLFQVMFALQNAPVPELALPGLSVTGAHFGGRNLSLFELILTLNRSADGFVGQLDYATDLFEVATAERIATHLRVLLESVVARPDASLADLALDTPEAQARLVKLGHGDVVDFDVESTLHGLIEQQALRTPDADAVVFEETTLSFRQFDARANQLARHLRSLGVGPEVTVGLCLERSADALVAFLAVLKAGGAFVPFDPAAPAARKDFLLRDCGASVLLTTRALAEAWQPDVAHVVKLDVEQTWLAALSEEPLPPSAGPDNLAYVIYTSGSTGTPKGVMVQHRSVVHLHRTLTRNVYAQQGPLRVSLNSPLYFDAVIEAFIKLLDGHCLCVIPEDTRRDPERMLTWMEARRIDVQLSTPSQLKLLLEAGLLDRAWVPSQFLVGGESMDEALWRLLAGTTRTRAINAYGPTEGTVAVTTFNIQGTALPRPVIGRPLDNLRAYVLDEHQRLVSFGLPGELCFSGAGITRGYLGRPDLTAERFVPDPFSTEPGARLYRTGDKARWREDGTLDFMGRLDFQVKLRGYRIELGEVEATLRSHPGIRDAVALVREDVPGDARLVAYVAPEVDTTSLREHLRKHLPEYMVPAAIMALPALPLTPNDKVDRKALPAPEASQVAASTYVAPETPTEVALAALWSEVLRVPRVGRHDNFFELGGHSLLATQLVTRVRAHFRVELPLRAFFERPTVAELAALIDSFQGPDGTEASLPPLVRAERPEVIPLSFAQQRLWFIEQLGTVGTAYSIPVGLKIEGTLDMTVLQRAFDELVRRHEALRTTFRPHEGTPSQVIHPPFPMPLRFVDLSSIEAPEARQAEALRVAGDEARIPFSLEQGPLVRVLVLKLGPAEHGLVLTQHHIISDGWSTGVLVREIGALYTAFSQGLPSPLVELAVQYADHSLWQRGWLQGEVLERQLGFWRDQLDGAAPYLDLPTDHPRPAQQSFQGADQLVSLPLALSEALETLAKQASATPYMLLLAAFKLLLHRYSGQEDVLIGSPIAGRRHAESEALIGYFANTVVIRTQVEPSLTFRELLTRVRATTLGAYEHQDLPFEKLVEDLKPERDLSRAPFFQVTFTLQNAPMPELVLPELTLRPMMGSELRFSLFDLQLLMRRGPDGFGGTLLYNTALFSPETMARMAHRFQVLLDVAVASPDVPLARLPLLMPEERRQVLVEWNRTSREYPRDASVAGLFSAQAARTPDAVALKSGEKTLSYAALDRASNQVAHHLRRSGVRPGDRVGLCLERSFELIVGMLGILKAGAAYVPVEAKYPADRIAWMLQEAGVSVLVTQESLADELPAVTDLQVLLDADAAVLAKQPETPLELEVPAEALAYVMFTSGSTGRPKGVSVPQRGIVRLVRGNDFIHFGPEEVFLQLAPVAFDASTLEVWGALLNGAKLVLAPAKALSFEETGALLITEGITTLWLTAALFEQMVIHQGEALAGVRQVLAGGDVLPVERVREHLARMPSRAVLVNGYGPTENTTFSATHTLRAGDSVGRSVPIGRSLAQSTAWVLDAALQPVPVGVPGALYVGGDGLAWGYLKRPDLTAERFIPHPFATEPGARLYSTGDRVRWQADGTLEFLGRTDFQVKIRGFRIEPGEVEAVLRQSSQVREAVALVREDVPGDKRLVAYIVAAADAGDVEQLKAFAQKLLPDYMVPSAFVALPALPLSANGKVDRKALPAPEAPRVSTAKGAAPRNAMETALAAIWAEVLHLEAIGIHDDFFELGGHSLLATQVVSRIRSTLGVELPLGDLFGAPTVATLAEKLGSARRTQAPPLVRTERTTAPPLSFAQQRLWFIDQLEPGTSLYNMPLPLRLSGALDEGALRKSLDALMARHEALRTTFRVEAGQPVQHIHSEATVPFESVDLTGIADLEERQAEAKRRGIAEFRRPFNLEQGPVIRALLMKLDAEDHILVVHVHHIVSDGWSLGVMVREVTTFYEAFRQGQTPALPELPVQYADYAVWQRNWLQGDVLKAQLGWWKQQLAGASHVLELPIDKPRPAVVSQRGAAVSVQLPQALSEQVEALAQREGATPFMVLLAAFQSVLHRHSGQDDVLVGSPIANRGHAETEGLIGFFVNTLVLRGSFGARPTFRQLLAQVRTTTLGAYEHQDLPFERLVEELQTTRDLSRTPLFQALFALQNAPLSAATLPGLALRPAEFGSRTTTLFELSLDLRRSEEGFAGRLEYATDLFEPATAERIATHLRVLLESVVARPDAPLADLSLDTLEAQTRLVKLGHGDVVDFDLGSTVHGLFEAQVARTPDADAVVFEETTLSFRQLDARANQLARHLRSLGVGPEVTVGLCLERSADALVAFLAVLKAGGAFVPFDPAAPDARKAYVLEDSRASVLLTTQALTEAWRPDVAHVVKLDAEAAHLATLSEEPLPPSAGPENLAYVIYTSGSTGMPKGVMVQHRSVAHLHHTLARNVYTASRRLRVSLSVPLYFDAVIEPFTKLLDGHCLCVIPEETRLEPARMLSWLEQHRVDVLVGTPAQLKILLDAGMMERTWVPSQLMLGGEALDEVTWRLLATTDRTRAFNGYGPTETTVSVTTFDIQGTALPRPVIGRPLDNLRAYVLDEHQRLVSFGLPGELCLSGEGVTRGYLGRPALTAERFVPDPFSTEPGARLYRTGDKARWREDGTLDLLGRLDFQVKLRGYRIELGEVEATLRSHPGIRDAVALVREDVPGDARLVAWVVPEVDTAPLREHLRKHLPEYMVPVAFMALPALPLTPNGKVDRKALPAPEASRQSPRITDAPGTPTEVALAALWSEVLRVPTVGRHDNFFELGGHSLLATQVVARVRARFGVELPVRALFESPTVATLALRLPDAPTATVLPPLVPAATPGPHPLSFAQQRLWFIDQLDPGSPLYNMPTALRLSGTVDVPRLQQTFDALVQRHESLRTTFETHDGEPLQRIHPAPAQSLFVVDLTSLPHDAREAEVLRLASEDALRPFDLASGPLVRITLVKVDVNEHVLLLCLHHAISDGWSIGVLVREVIALYEAFRQGLPSPLPPLPVQYADYAVWQRNWLQGDALETQLGWWKRQLAGAPQALALPTDKPRPPRRSSRGAMLPVRIPPALSEAVEALAQKEGATPFMVLLSAFQTLLYRYSGQDDLLVGTSIAGRRHAETEGLIGFFVNTLVLRARFDDRPSFRQVLAQVRANTLGAYEHQDIPFERLVEALQPARDLSRTPLIQALFVLQNTPESGARLPELTLRPVGVEANSTKFDLDLSMGRTDRGFEGALFYSTDLFEAATARRLTEHLVQLLEGAVAQPDAAVETLTLLSADERQWVLEEWSGETADFPADLPFHTRFEQQVTRTPKAPALVMGDTTVSFHQLNVRANQLAHYLRTLGVGPEVPVAFSLERSPEAIVTLLAILKAGGAYVPLDPSAPAARKDFILENSGATVLLTTQALAEAWQPAVRHLVRLDTEARRIDALSPGNPRVDVRPEHVAYVLYTSGSTGMPKGVMVQHRSIVHLHRAMADVPLSAVPRVLRASLNAPLNFDISVGQLSLLLDGHGLCLIQEDVRQEPERMLAWMEQHRIDVLDCTPSQLKSLLEAGLLERAHVPETLLICGEAVDEATWRTLAATKRTRAFNLYGPTEGTVYATWWCIQDATQPVPVIGRPLVNMGVFVLDANLNPVSVGVPGELFISGEGLARGYRARADLTAERFIPHPFSTEPGARLYRTGDRVRWRQDGTLDFMGRLDFQVKLRGYRIELGEIEAALRTHPGLRDAVALVREDVPGLPRLVAYVAPAVDTAPLRGHLLRTLPDYMVPSAFVSLPALPLNSNGKVDRKALPVPNADVTASGPLVGPRDATEALLARLWAQTLGLSAVDVRTSLFELGGHSLLAVRLIAAVNRETGRRLPLSALFQAPSVEQFARLMNEAEDTRPFSSLVPFAKQGAGTAPPFFCVHPVGGNVLAYAELARQLGPDQSFYGLQSRGLDGTSDPSGTVEEMATHYVRELRMVQPAGPYHLGGWSLGGVIAYEMAHQLRAAGEEVALLALIDSYVPETVAASEPPLDRTLAVGLFAQDLMGVSLADLALDTAELATLEPEAALTRVLESAVQAGALPPGVDSANPVALFRVFEANLEAARRYHPPAMEQRVLRVQAEELADTGPGDGGWSALVGERLESHRLPGNHYTLLREPTVRTVADLLKKALRDPDER